MRRFSDMQEGRYYILRQSLKRLYLTESGGMGPPRRIAAKTNAQSRIAGRWSQRLAVLL